MSFFLNDEEVERYKSHILLAEIGGRGQQKLKASKVLVIGAGGLGAPVLSYLCGAGIGHLGVIDDDKVERSNLQRQIIHKTSAIGHYKTNSARQTLSQLNPHSHIITFQQRLCLDNCRDIIDDFDVIVDGSDNFDTRYMVAQCAEEAKKPLVSGALSRFAGNLTVLMPYENDNPRYVDIFPKLNQATPVPTCANQGVIAPLGGIIGSLQAMEVLKLILNIGTPLIGRLLLYDSLETSFNIISYQRR